MFFFFGVLGEGGSGGLVGLLVSMYPHMSLSGASAKTLTGECVLRDRWVSKTVCPLQPGQQHEDRVRQSIHHAYKGHGPLMAPRL